MNKKITVLDGARDSDKNLDPILTLLINVLQHQYKAETKVFPLRNIKINPCIGCFSCWLKTPGRCVHRDAVPDILQEILDSDTVIFFTPIVFGGYSSELKKIGDRFLPMVLPFFKIAHGETHHLLRYSTMPHIAGIGVHPAPDKNQSECFRILVGRNALNLSSDHSAEVINSTTDSPEKIRDKFNSLLSRTDKPPLGNTLFSLAYNSTASIQKVPIGKRKVLLITGSQKANTSTSAVLGEYFLKILEKHNIETESLDLKETLIHCEQQRSLCRAVAKADIILLAAPLYFDALPFLVTKAFETIASHCSNVRNSPKIFFVLLNSGLPESYQNSAALSICRNFASEMNMTWAGGLTIGAGEALISGRSLTGFTGFRGLVKRPPLFYVTRALKDAASALAEGYPIPERVVHTLAEKTPVPLLSFNAWRYLLIKMSNRLLKKEVVKNGLSIQKVFDKPYAD